jgi:hypothetical protein
MADHLSSSHHTHNNSINNALLTSALPASTGYSVHPHARQESSQFHHQYQQYTQATGPST